MTRDIFSEYLNRLWNTLHIATFSYRIWWVFRNAEDAPRWERTVNRTPSFFAPTVRAHLESFVINIHSLFDMKHGTISFPGALRLAERRNYLEPDVIANARKVLDSRAEMMSKVRLLRHNVFAHRSEKLSVDDAFSRAGLKPDHMRILVECGMETLNIMSIAYERNHYLDAFDEAELDTREVLKTLMVAYKYD